MPGDKKHHTAKFRRCVEQVMAKGNDESSAYAICTTSLQDAGEPIFEAAEMHSLHLLAATGTTRTEMHQGKEYLVVPVVALMEGVIHAVNAKNREFVPLSTLQKAAASWNDRPVVLYHPQKAGKQCSANSPDIIASHGIGVIRNSRVEGTKLLQEAWIEKKKAKQLHPRMYEQLEANETVEVSVGAFVVTDDIEGEWNGRDYAGAWQETTGDHLAFLPGARGACSVAMGCGTNRAAAAHLVTAEGMVLMETEVFLTLEGQPLDDRMSAVYRAVEKKWGIPTPVATSGTYAYPFRTYDDMVIVKANDKYFKVPYTMSGEEVVLGEATEVKHTEKWVAAAGKKVKYKECAACRGTGSLNGNPCESCEGTGELRTASITTPCSCKTHKQHDTGSTAAAGPQLKAASCGCQTGAHNMADKATRAEQIAALVSDRYSGFNESDQAMLETASDSRLDEFRAAAARRQTEERERTKVDTDLTNVSARLKIAEDRLRAAQESPSEEEWLSRAPESIKAVIEEYRTAQAAQRADIIGQLKDLGQNTEAELKEMKTEQLLQLASYARVQVPDYSGRGLPQSRNAAANKNDIRTFEAPDPYAAGIKALQSKATH